MTDKSELISAIAKHKKPGMEVTKRIIKLSISNSTKIITNSAEIAANQYI
jgi:hypothetical protein